MDARQAHELVTRNIRVLMAVRGLQDQKELAAIVGWDAPKVSRTLKGRRDLTLADVFELAKGLDVEPTDLLGDTASLVGATKQPAHAVAASAKPSSAYVRRKSRSITSVPALTVVGRGDTDVAQSNASTRVVISNAA